MSVKDNEIIKDSSKEKWKKTWKIDFLKTQWKAKRSTEAAFGSCSKNKCFPSVYKNL